MVEVIPVLDLKGGAVVHARMGQRSQYRPIETPLSSSSNPVEVARGLLSIYPFATFYIADLDAIEGAGDNNAAIAQLKAEFPGLAFWVDNGVADFASANAGSMPARASRSWAARRKVTTRSSAASPTMIASFCRSTTEAKLSWGLRRC